jgi:hypothetical protein
LLVTLLENDRDINARRARSALVGRTDEGIDYGRHWVEYELLEWLRAAPRLPNDDVELAAAIGEVAAQLLTNPDFLRAREELARESARARAAADEAAVAAGAAVAAAAQRGGGAFGRARPPRAAPPPTTTTTTPQHGASIADLGRGGCGGGGRGAVSAGEQGRRTDSRVFVPLMHLLRAALAGQQLDVNLVALQRAWDREVARLCAEQFPNLTIAQLVGRLNGTDGELRAAHARLTQVGWHRNAAGERSWNDQEQLAWMALAQEQLQNHIMATATNLYDDQDFQAARRRLEVAAALEVAAMDEQQPRPQPQPPTRSAAVPRGAHVPAGAETGDARIEPAAAARAPPRAAAAAAAAAAARAAPPRAPPPAPRRPSQRGDAPGGAAAQPRAARAAGGAAAADAAAAGDGLRARTPQRTRAAGGSWSSSSCSSCAGTLRASRSTTASRPSGTPRRAPSGRAPPRPRPAYAGRRSRLPS